MMHTTIHSIKAPVKPDEMATDGDDEIPRYVESDDHQVPILLATLSDACTISSQSLAKRLERKLNDDQSLMNFLDTLDFKGANLPQPRGFFFAFWKESETVYPVHVAAKLGDYRLFRKLVAARADVNVKTSKGMSVIEVAELANKKGSHTKIIEFLKSDLDIMPMRSFHEMMKSQALDA